MAAAFPETIQYHYRKADDLPLKVAHGVWGGSNPHGEIEICFYEEGAMPPRLTTQKIGPDGMPGAEMMAADDSGRHIERNIHTRILLNYGTARAVLEWLEERLSELESEAPQEMYDGNSGIKQ